MSPAGLWRTGIVLAAGILLEIACRTGLVSSFVMIAPSQMMLALIGLMRNSPWFWGDFAYTGRNFLAATSLSVIGGLLGGFALHAMPRLRRILDPVLASYYSVPTFVLYPLMIVLFGIGPLSLIVMGAIFGIVAMLVATLNALDRIPRVFLKSARVDRLGLFRTTFLVRLPAATPHLFAGVKLAIAYCIIGVIAGEFILATAGIGRRLSLAYNDFDNKTMYGVLLLILIVSAGLTAILNACETRLQHRWSR